MSKIKGVSSYKNRGTVNMDNKIIDIVAYEAVLKDISLDDFKKMVSPFTDDELYLLQGCTSLNEKEDYSKSIVLRILLLERFDLLEYLIKERNYKIKFSEFSFLISGKNLNFIKFLDDKLINYLSEEDKITLLFSSMLNNIGFVVMKLIDNVDFNKITYNKIYNNILKMEKSINKKYFNILYENMDKTVSDEKEYVNKILVDHIYTKNNCSKKVEELDNIINNIFNYMKKYGLKEELYESLEKKVSNGRDKRLYDIIILGIFNSELVKSVLKYNNDSSSDYYLKVKDIIKQILYIRKKLISEFKYFDKKITNDKVLYDFSKYMKNITQDTNELIKISLKNQWIAEKQLKENFVNDLEKF